MAKLVVMVQQGLLIGEVVSLLGLESNSNMGSRMAGMSAMMPSMKTA